MRNRADTTLHVLEMVIVELNCPCPILDHHRSLFDVELVGNPMLEDKAIDRHANCWLYLRDRGLPMVVSVSMIPKNIGTYFVVVRAVRPISIANRPYSIDQTICLIRIRYLISDLLVEATEDYRKMLSANSNLRYDHFVDFLDDLDHCDFLRVPISIDSNCLMFRYRQLFQWESDSNQYVLFSHR